MNITLRKLSKERRCVYASQLVRVQSRWELEIEPRVCRDLNATQRDLALYDKRRVKMFRDEKSGRRALLENVLRVDICTKLELSSFTMSFHLSDFLALLAAAPGAVDGHRSDGKAQGSDRLSFAD